MTHFFFIALGRGNFPIDMLREDECQFANKEAEEHSGMTHLGIERGVALLSMRKPRLALWQKHGWVVGGVTRVDGHIPTPPIDIPETIHEETW